MDCTHDDIVDALKRAYERQHLLFTTANAAYLAVGGSKNLTDMLVADDVCKHLKKRLNKALLDRAKSVA